MRALFFVNSFAGGGAERVCLNLAKQLYKSGIASDFVTVYNTKAAYDIPDHIHILSLEIDERSSFRETFFGIIRQVPRVNAFISKKEYVLITAHLPSAHFLASLSKAAKKTLYVMHVAQNLTDSCHSKCYGIGLRLFYKGKQLVTVSKGLKYELEHQYKIPKKRITTIYNPSGLSAFQTDRRPVSPHARPYILFMGRLEEQKNPLLALDLYYKGKFYKDHDLVYLGKGALEARLKKRVAKYHLQDYVFFAGFQKNPKPWLANASLLLSCSRQEGLPMNIVEALICQVPVVAADCPYGPGEILTGELAEYLIYPEKKFDESIAVIASALKAYPEIPEKFYDKFDDALIVQRYLAKWKTSFKKEHYFS